ncbi:MAG: phospholipase D-like domain-containing protein, partial [Candidatus Omnitrophota bacterium]|nr:phospholipase D-like domain-containing protein [Candidatus Omnitrophota bacterium]
CLKIPKAFPLKSNKLRIASFFIILALCLPVFAADQVSEFYPAKAAPRTEIHSTATSEMWISGARVEDISDRAYEPAVIKLLDSAKESIIMSMYVVKSSDNGGPVRLLVHDLEEALDRGVKVEIYINTRPGHGMPSGSDIDLVFKSLTDKGAKIYKVTPYYLLHDKLIIVDGRFCVVGSTNWSVAALKSNYESTVLIDSPELAKAKLLRLRNFLLEGYEKEKKERPDRPKALEPLPGGTVVSVNKELLNNKNYFSAMLKAQANRDMDTYLILLAESARTGEKEFFVPLEDLAVTLGISPEWSDTDMRRQMIKELKALQDKYKLIDVNFNYGKDAWVELKDLPGGTFKVGGSLFDPKNLASKSQPAKVVFLIKVLLEAEGKSIDSVGASAVAKRFGVSEFSVRKGIREIGEKKGR